MEEDEDIKKSVEKQENYDEFSIKNLLDEINSLKKKLKFLENLLKNTGVLLLIQGRSRSRYNVRGRAIVGVN